MSEFVEQCRQEWRRLRVPRKVADEMAAELESDLAEAAADGVTAAEVLGGDPRRFAASWASERGVIPRARTRLLLPTALAAFVALAVSGALVAAFAPASQTVRPRGLVTLALHPPAAQRNPVTVTATTVWVAAPEQPLVETRSGSATRTVGIALLFVGLGGGTALALLAMRERGRRVPGRAASR